MAFSDKMIKYSLMYALIFLSAFGHHQTTAYLFRLLPLKNNKNSSLYPRPNLIKPTPKKYAATTSLYTVSPLNNAGSFLSKSITSSRRFPVTALRGGAVVLATASSSASPLVPLGSWILPAFACATFYAMYNLFIKKASASIDPILGGVLLQFVAALVGSILLLYKQTVAAAVTNSTARTVLTKSGLIWSVAAGVAVGVAEILSFIISGKGVPASKSIPIVVGGSIVVGTLLGSSWLNETLTKSGWMGVLLIAVGIALVGMDPGSGMAH
jgi:transporter family protein